MQYWKPILLGVAVFALAGGFTSLSRGVPVEAAKVTRGDIRQYVDEEAKTRLADTYLMTMPYNGRINPQSIWLKVRLSPRASGSLRSCRSIRT